MRPDAHRLVFTVEAHCQPGGAPVGHLSSPVQPRAQRAHAGIGLGLLYPGQKGAAETQKSAKPTGSGKQDKGSPSQSAADSQKLPRHWLDVDIGNLVLAKSDGPWLDYWEAIPFEKVGDMLKMRWRDETDLAPIMRSRFDLALICPDAA